MSKEILYFERGTSTPKTELKFGKVDPGDVSGVAVTVDAKNTGTDTMDVVCKLVQISTSPIVLGITGAINHKRGMSSLATYTLSWDIGLGESIMVSSPIPDFQANDILEIDFIWSPDSGLPASPTVLPGSFQVVEV